MGIRIIIADDHQILRQGLKTLLEKEPDMEVVAEAEDGRKTVTLVREFTPHVVIMDVNMPDLNGIEATRQILSEYPEMKVIALSMHADRRFVINMLKAGAHGYLLKDTSPHQLLHAIRDVYRGEPSMHPTIARKLMLELQRSSELPPTEEPLTEREAEVLSLVAQGLTNQEIADLLFVSERTVRTHVSNILGKLHLANRTQAALYALRKGWASLDET